MRSLRQVARPPLVLLAVLALTTGCEDNGVMAPSDGQMIMTANPADVVIDEVAGETEGQSTITAQLFDANGFALQGVDLFFSTTGGSLASAPPGQAATAVVTDANGRASDVLTLVVADLDLVTVSASSGTLSGSVEVTKTVGSENQPPEALIDVDPADGQRVGESVTFDGSFSIDPDGAITCYKWTISSNAVATQVVQGQTRRVVTRQFAVEQSLTVTLRVSDFSDSASWCSDCDGTVLDCGADNSFFNGFEDTIISYPIACDLTDPVASAGPDQIVTLSGGQALVSLDGSGSSDPESGISSYVWTCGNGTASQSGVQVTCTYTNSGIFTAGLTVTNGCGMVDSDEAKVTVNAP